MYRQASLKAVDRISLYKSMELRNPSHASTYSFVIFIFTRGKIEFSRLKTQEACQINMPSQGCYVGALRVNDCRYAALS